MAKRSPRPGRTLLVFFISVAVLYGLAALGGTWKPQLGLDLEGGTRITLTTVSNVNATKMKQAASIIDARAASGGEASYTRKLLDKGPEHCAKKFGEEAVETVIAAVGTDRDHLVAESADVLFHLLVLLKSRGVRLEEVEAALESRTGMSGLEEKAARKRE